MDLDGGTGFDHGFLSEAVDPPGCDLRGGKPAGVRPGRVAVVDGQIEIRYMHFSLVMHGHRRLVRWVAWNIDGVTRWDGEAPDDRPELPGGVPLVVKPTVSAGSRNTARYAPDENGVALRHARRLLDLGRTIMVQPYRGTCRSAGGDRADLRRRSVQSCGDQGGTAGAGEAGERGQAVPPPRCCVPPSLPPWNARWPSARRRWPCRCWSSSWWSRR